MNRFCSSCGMQQGSPGALFCENCGSALAPPPGSSRTRWLPGVAIAAGSLMLVTALVWAAFQFWPRPDPRDIPEHIRLAFLSHDVAAFERHVALDRVLTDALAQAASLGMQEVAATNLNMTPAASALAASAAAATATLAAPQLVPELARLCRQLVSAGTWATQGIATTANDPSPVLMQFVSEALASQLTYRGAEVLGRQGPAVQVAVSMATPLQAQPLTIRLRMEMADEGWRVVGVEDLAGLIRQVEAMAGVLSSSGAKASTSPNR